MKITLYSGITKRKNSTMLPEDSPGVITFREVDVALKANTSKENPVFLIESSNFTYNYAKWEDHYYFIDDIVSTARNLIELHCSQDVLATYKAAIGEYTAFVARASNTYDPFLNDSAISSQQPIIANTISETAIDLFSEGHLPSYKDSYLLRIISSNGTNNSSICGYLLQDLSDLGPILDPANYIGQQPEEGQEWYTALGNLFFDPAKYIINVYRTPISHAFFAEHLATGDGDIFVKWFDCGISAPLQTVHRWSNEFNLNTPGLYYNDFRDFNPNFVQYNIYLPGVGTQPLPSEYMNSPLRLKYMFDVDTGDIFYQLKNVNASTQNNSIVASYVGNVYSQTQLGRANANIGNVIESASNSIVAGALGHIGGAVSSLIEGTKALTSPAPSINGVQQSGISIYFARNVIISRMIHGSSDIPMAVNGRPLCRNVLLKSIPGFIQCEAASIALPGLGGDTVAVNSYLNGGFYYE